MLIQTFVAFLFSLSFLYFLYFSLFIQAFVACALGFEMLGFVLMTFGCSACVTSILCGFLTKKVGRIPIYTVGKYSLIFNESVLMICIHLVNMKPLSLVGDPYIYSLVLQLEIVFINCEF